MYSYGLCPADESLIRNACQGAHTAVFDLDDIVPRGMRSHELAFIRRTEHVAHIAHQSARPVFLFFSNREHIHGHQISSTTPNRRGDGDLAKDIAASDQRIPPPKPRTEAEHHDTRDHRPDANGPELKLRSTLVNSE